MVSDSQRPGSDHQDCANKGRHHLNSEVNSDTLLQGADLEEVGHQVSDESGEGEHQEDHQETHAPPYTSEVGINTTKSKLTTLVQENIAPSDIYNDVPGTQPWP